MGPPRPAIALVALVSGCAGYAGAVHEMRLALLDGDKERALDLVDDALDVGDPEEMPEDVGGDNALLVLERGTIKQGLGRPGSSAADFGAADKNMELLDLKNDTAGNIGKYLFSDDATVYKAPAYEKLLLNTLNMLNYLSAGDIEGARVEARRLRVIQGYLADEGSEQGALLGLGGYLAGFAFEMSGRAEDALQFYDEALAEDAHPSLAGPITRLAACTVFRTDRIRAALGPAPAPVSDAADAGAPPPSPACDPNPKDRGTILVVATTGLAPHKEAVRIPIGAALVIAANVTAGPGMGMSDQAQANELAAKGLLTWINFPVMKRTRERFSGAAVRVDGEPADVELGLDVTERVLRAWDSIKGTLMVAAITRMIARAVAGEVAQRGAKAGGTAGAVALLAGLAVEGALVATDTPDTRSWVTLPSKVFLSRIEVAPGRRRVVVTLHGPAGREEHAVDVDVRPGGFAVVPVSAMR